MLANSRQCANVARCRVQLMHAAPTPNQPIMKISLLLSVCLFPFAMAFVSCKEKGPAEKAGEGVDRAVEKVEDAVNPKGPVEKAGEKIDKALDK